MTEPTLLEALGSPCLEALPPPAATAEWSARRAGLRRLLFLSGCRAPLRTPASLWAAAGAVARPQRRWAQLAGIPLAALVARLALPPSSSAIRIATWNTRWLLSPHTEQGTRKRAFINDLLLQGTVVALQ